MKKTWTLGGLITVPPEDGYYGNVPVGNQAPPSTYAVAAVLEKEPGSFVRLVGVTAIRAVFIIPGIWIAAKLTDIEIKPPWKLVATGFAASCTISGGMLLWYWLKKKGIDVGSVPPVLDGLKKKVV